MLPGVTVFLFLTQAGVEDVQKHCGQAAVPPMPGCISDVDRHTQKKTKRSPLQQEYFLGCIINTVSLLEIPVSCAVVKYGLRGSN